MNETTPPCPNCNNEVSIIVRGVLTPIGNNQVLAKTDKYTIFSPVNDTIIYVNSNSGEYSYTISRTGYLNPLDVAMSIR